MDMQIASLCDSAVDYNGKLVIVGTFDTIGTATLPAMMPPCALALRMVFRKDHEKKDRHTLHIDFLDEDAKAVVPQLDANFEVRLAPEMAFFTQNVVFNLQGIALTKDGVYSVDISLDGRKRASIPLQVRLVSQDALPGAARTPSRNN